MFLINRKALAFVGATAAALGSTALLASPAQAAATGVAKVAGAGTVQFTAASAKANGLTITLSGKTVTLDDLVPLKAGAGCKAVAGDKTKVTCTTSGVTGALTVNLGDKNDWVRNKTAVRLVVTGGTGNDALYGGSASDKLTGGAGNDKIFGGAGNDAAYGDAGNDVISGHAGNDSLSAGAGNDKVYGDAGDDKLYGGAGNDLLNGAAGLDKIYGNAGNDKIYAGSGEVVRGDEVFGDEVTAGAGNDTIFGEAGYDFIDAGTGNDVVNAGAGDDAVLGWTGNDTIAGGAGHDLLIGESIEAVGDTYRATGSNTAKDKINGGAGIDLGLVRKAGKTTAVEAKTYNQWRNLLASTQSASVAGAAKLS